MNATISLELGVIGIIIALAVATISNRLKDIHNVLSQLLQEISDHRRNR